MQWLGALGAQLVSFFIADKLGEYVLFWLATWLDLTSRAKAQVCIGPTPFPKSVDAKERVLTCWDWPAPGFSEEHLFPTLRVGINIEKKYPLIQLHKQFSFLSYT